VKRFLSSVDETGLNVGDVLRWLSGRRAACGGRMTVYGREFARLQGGVVVDVRQAMARRRGGEPLDAVLGQPETDELYRLGVGFFLLSDCGDDTTSPPDAFHRASYLNDWMAATRLLPRQVRTANHTKHTQDRPQGWIPNQNLTGTPSPSLHFLSLPFPPLRSRPP